MAAAIRAALREHGGSLLAFLPVPVIVWGSIRFQRRLEPLYRDVREAAGEVSATVSTNLGGLTTIKAFTAEEREGFAAELSEATIDELEDTLGEDDYDAARVGVSVEQVLRDAAADLREQAPEADRFGGELAPHQRIARRGGVTFVEDEIEDGHHRRQSLR